MFGGQSSHIPLKVNTAGVIPVIFASSMLQLPVVIASFAGVKPASGEGASLIQKFLKVCNQSDWCNISSWGDFKYTLGLLVYIALVIFFAYFYTSVTFNPLEISNNRKSRVVYSGYSSRKTNNRLSYQCTQQHYFYRCCRNGYRMCASNRLLRCVRSKRILYRYIFDHHCWGCY